MAMNPEIWRYVFDAIEDAVFLHDAQFRVVLVNRAYCCAAGMTEAQALGKPYWEVFPPGSGPMPGCKEATIEKGHTGSREEMSVGAKLFLSTGYTVRDDQDKPLYSLHVLSDITTQRQAEAALTESEERFRRAIDTARDAIITLDGESGAITAWNPAAEVMFGYGKEEAIGRVLHDFLPSPRFREAATKGMVHFATTGEGAAIDQTLELAALHKNGTEFPVELSLSAAQIHGNWHATGIVRDITERKQAEEAWRENQARLDLALRSASMGAWHLENIENRRYFDDQTCRLLGLDSTSFTGTAKEFFGAVHPDDRETIRAALARTMEQDWPYEPEFRAVWPDGSVHYITSRGKLVRDDKGRPARVSGIIWDITARKQAEAEAEIARLSQWNALLLNSAGEGIYGVDRDGGCTFVNPAALSILGFNKEEVLGNRLHPIFHHHHEDGSAYPEDDCPIYLTLRDGMQRKVEDAFIRKNGEVFPVQISVTPMHENGQLVGVVVVFQDIGRRKAMEQELMRLATTDPLTGVANRRHFIEQLEMELARIKRSGDPAAFLMVDIDHFKNVNDSYGHAIGDTVLQHLAELSRRRLRRIDLFGRLGGEEFGILLPGTDGAKALQFAEHFRRHVADTPAQSSKGMIPFTISIGVAEFAPSDSASDSILARADVALYRAKEGGRNRVEIGGPRSASVSDLGLPDASGALTVQL